MVGSWCSSRVSTEKKIKGGFSCAQRKKENRNALRARVSVSLNVNDASQQNAGSPLLVYCSCTQALILGAIPQLTACLVFCAARLSGGLLVWCAPDVKSVGLTIAGKGDHAPGAKEETQNKNNQSRNQVTSENHQDLPSKR